MCYSKDVNVIGYSFHSYFKGRNFRVQKLSCVKKTREIYGINFRVSRILEQISWKKLSRIVEKVYFRVKKLSRMSKRNKIYF